MKKPLLTNTTAKQSTMARVKPSLITIKGKLGEKIIQGEDGNQTVRDAPKKGAKKNETALKRQNDRTPLLNKLSSELVDIVNQYALELKRKRLYQAFQGRFRKEKLDNRWMLLKTLEHFDIHQKYTLGKLSLPDIEWKQAKGSIDIVVRTTAHPPAGRNNADSYSYELVMVAWNKTKKPPKHERKMSSFVPREGKLSKFTFKFKIPSGTIHWLLFLGIQLGHGEEEIGFKETSGMRIMHAGTFDKKDEELWEEKMKETKNIPKRSNAKKNLPRVKPDED